MEFERLLKSDKYQVFLMGCPANMPFFFATHPWFVTNRKGDVSRFGNGRSKASSRYEVYFQKAKGGQSWGHVHKDWLPPFQGIEVFPYSQRFFWKGRLLGVVEGDEGSLAERMAAFIEKSGENYPFAGRYSIFGPNSNTYAQWILNQFPASGLKLPWNSFGKNYDRR